jgi:hypothetical protein
MSQFVNYVNVEIRHLNSRIDWNEMVEVVKTPVILIFVQFSSR